jgi:hypothetical protein
VFISHLSDYQAHYSYSRTGAPMDANWMRSSEGISHTGRSIVRERDGEVGVRLEMGLVGAAGFCCTDDIWH